MRLSTILNISILAPLVLAVILCALITTLPFSEELPTWTSQGREFIKQSTEILTLNQMNSTRKFLEAYFNQVGNDITILHKCAASSINPLNDTLWSKSRNYFHTYSAQSAIITSDNGRIPSNDVDGISIASTVFKLGLTSYNQLLSMDYVNSSSLIDICFRSIYKSSDLFVKIYLGDNQGVFRRFPYVNLDSYETLSYTSALTMQIKTGYDPRERAWYVIAMQDVGTTKFTAPYKDAFSGKMHISIAKSVGTWGVIAGDFPMEKIDEIILGNKILTSGYMLLMDSNGLVISHPNLDRNVLNTMIYSIEPTISPSILSSILTYQRNGTVKTSIVKQGSIWHLLYSNVNICNYKLVILYPDSDLTIISNKLNEYVDQQLTSYNIVIGVVFSFLVCLAAYVLFRISRKYVASFNMLSRVLDTISKGNVEQEKGNESAYSSEVQELLGEFRHLLITHRSAKIHFYGGDYAKSLENSKLTLDLMIQRKNVRGIGVCYNNIANAQKELGDFSNAKINYEKAIANAKELMSFSDKSEGKEYLAYRVSLANRMMNLAVLYISLQDTDAAIKLLDDAYKIHKECDNPMGMCKTIMNLTQAELLKKSGKTSIHLDGKTSIHLDGKSPETFGKSLTKFPCALRSVLPEDVMGLKGVIPLADEALAIAHARRDPRLLEYSFMNRAVLSMHMQDLTAAKNDFNKALTVRPNVDYYVKDVCLKNLNTICSELRESLPVEVACFKEEKISIANDPRHVCFVIDRSGSMDGSPIQMCRDSIKSIIVDILNDDDHISVLTFNNVITRAVSLVQKRGNVDGLISAIEKNTIADGGTRFYDAVVYAIENIKYGKSQDWIVVLTDGADDCYTNSTSSRLIDEKVATVKKCVSNFNGTLIIMTKGELQNLSDIENICKSAPRGKHLRIDDKHNGISLAFGKVAKIIVGQLNFENL